MDETSIDWADLRIFLAVARHKSLAAAAKNTGQSAATLGRHVTDLERALGEELFKRLPQGYEMTDAARKLLAKVEAVEDRILDIVRDRRSSASTIPIRISAGTWMTWFLSRNIAQIRTADRSLVFSATEEIHNIGRRETLIGIRNRMPTEPGVATRKTATVHFAAYARADGSSAEDWISTTINTPSAKWVRAAKRDRVRIEVTHPRSLLDLVLAGAGQAVLPCFVGDAHESLIRTGPIIEELSHEQWLAVHGEERHLPPVRDTIDAIAKLISSQKSLFAPATQTSFS
ncbi:LysR family transcriptional regulator [Aliirhizobium smilacinae]|uniref:LysR family transcriptional regulator n=1 Tax=Aliirhizobium smilacinae TaxID=1395944 RepID=A0A5C4XAY7_9HYPH|nr:LysR family transcriptional regulator [Rhizobium smilacinae]TNM59900.1 LysR family transcriptional regulator [Rhizobium smilacinae]